MKENTEKHLIKYHNGLVEPNREQEDHLVASIEQFKEENGRYPRQIIFNEEFAQRYFNRYKQGEAMGVTYKHQHMTFIVNIRMRAGNLLIS